MKALTVPNKIQMPAADGCKFSSDWWLHSQQIQHNVTTKSNCETYRRTHIFVWIRKHPLASLHSVKQWTHITQLPLALCIPSLVDLLVSCTSSLIMPNNGFQTFLHVFNPERFLCILWLLKVLRNLHLTVSFCKSFTWCKLYCLHCFLQLFAHFSDNVWLILGAALVTSSRLLRHWVVDARASFPLSARPEDSSGVRRVMHGR